MAKVPKHYPDKRRRKFVSLPTDSGTEISERIPSSSVPKSKTIDDSGLARLGKKISQDTEGIEPTLPSARVRGRAGRSRFTDEGIVEDGELEGV